MRNYNKYKKYAQKKRKLTPIKIAIICLFFMSILTLGYSTFQDTTTITGTANIGSFTITYNLNGGTNVANPITTYYATTNGALPIPTYTNHTFDGWYENDTFSGTAISTTPTRKQCQGFSIIC